jgi:integrase
MTRAKRPIAAQPGDHKIVPTEWHTKPRGKAALRCPHCGAPACIQSTHRRLPAERGEAGCYEFMRHYRGACLVDLYRPESQSLDGKVNPGQWHRKPPRKHGSRCPHCGAPGLIRSIHRLLSSREGQAPAYEFLQSCEGASVVCTYRRQTRQKGIPHRYPNTSKRSPITPKVLQRIRKATQLFGYGRTWKQVAAEMHLSEKNLLDYYERHRPIWETLIKQANQNVSKTLKRLAGTPEIFENGGKLIRLAVDVAQEEKTPLFEPPIAGKLSLSEFLEKFYITSRIRIGADHLDRLRSQVVRFNAFFGKQVVVEELNERDLCRYLAALRESKSGVTVNKARGLLLAIWRSAYDNGICERPPRLGLIRRCPEEVDPPEAWTVEECNRLFEAAIDVNGKISNIPAGLWWRSLLFTIYWTACRIGALVQTPTSSYDGAGLLVRRQKNRRPQFYPLPESCRAAIEETNPAARALLWPWPQHQRTLWVKMREIVSAAGIRQPPGGRQLFHRLRRTTLSLCAAIDPAIAQRQAGHADYATTMRHYVDPRIACGRSAADVLPEPSVLSAAASNN